MPEASQVAIKDLQQYPFVLIPKAFFDREPSLNALAVYLALRYFASNQTGKAHLASIPTMAKLVNISVSTFQRGTRELIKKGLVRVRRRRQQIPNGKPRALTNVYQLLDLEPINTRI